MARIRSVHPSLFTDDNFMELSANAKLMLIGVWTEAHDDGVFAWKPKGIKARILPAENCDAEAILVEMVDNGFVRRFEHDGKHYGAVRNFRKFQRPKKPNESGVLPNELRIFVGLEPVGSDPVPNQFPTPSEIAPQMEDGGGRKEEKVKSSSLRSEDKPRGERASVISILRAVVSEDRVKALMAHRTKMRAGLTEHTAKLLAGTLSEAADPNAAADEMMLRGWKSWKPDWSQIGKGTGPPQAQPNMISRHLRDNPPPRKEPIDGHP